MFISEGIADWWKKDMADVKAKIGEIEKDVTQEINPNTERPYSSAKEFYKANLKKKPKAELESPLFGELGSILKGVKSILGLEEVKPDVRVGDLDTLFKKKRFINMARTASVAIPVTATVLAAYAYLHKKMHEEMNKVCNNYSGDKYTACRKNYYITQLRLAEHALDADPSNGELHKEVSRLSKMVNKYK
jgi:hypothetical protein